MKLPIDQFPSSNLRNCNIRLAFFDVDGTLRDSSGTIPDEVKSAISSLADRHVSTALATGRTLFSVRPILSNLKITAPCILGSGTSAYDPSSNTVIHRTAPAQDVLRELVSACREQKFPLELSTNDDYFVEPDASSPLFADHFSYLPHPAKRVPFEQVIASGEVLKAELLIPNEDRGRVEAMMEKFPSIYPIFGKGAAHPQLYFTSILPREASVEKAFHAVLRHLNESGTSVQADQTLNFGDSEGDLELFSLTKVSVAMGNAPPHVQDRAAFVTRSVEEAGVAYALGIIFR